MYREPTSHIIDPSTGGMTSTTGRYEKRLKDLEGIYLDENCFRSAASSRGDEIVYSVNEVRPTEATGDLIFGTTHMEPGRIGDEFYMTRGHIHAVANRPEVYYGESGAGVMLMESLDGETRVLEVTPLLGNPHVGVDQLVDFVAGLAGDKAGDDGRNFLRALAANRRLGTLPEIAARGSQRSTTSPGKSTTSSW